MKTTAQISGELNHKYQVFWRLLVLLLVLIALLAGCTPGEQKEALADLRVVVQDLPKVEGFDLLGSHEESWSRGGSCFYARAYLIFGTDLAVPELLNAYTEAVEGSGWSLLTDEYARTNMSVRVILKEEVTK